MKGSWEGEEGTGRAGRATSDVTGVGGGSVCRRVPAGEWWSKGGWVRWLPCVRAQRLRAELMSSFFFFFFKSGPLILKGWMVRMHFHFVC